MVRHGRSRHLNIIASEEEEHGVAAETDEIEEQDHLNGSFRSQLQSFQYVSAHKDADTRPGNGDTAREHAGLALGQVELSLQVLGQEDDEPGDDD